MRFFRIYDSDKIIIAQTEVENPHNSLIHEDVSLTKFGKNLRGSVK